MDISRRCFLGGAVALGAMQGCRVFLDPVGIYREGKPRLRFGVISDVHIIAANTDRGTCGNPRTLEHTLKWFDLQQVDAVMVVGDICDAGLVSELQVFADSWYKIFPNDRSSLDGRKVEKLFVYGNHDWEGHSYNYTVFENKSNDLTEDWIREFGVAKTWERLFNEEYSPVYKKTVRGYEFIGAHWDGTAGSDWKGIHQIKPWFEANGRKINPELPFFFFQHPHPKDTCYGSWAWGHDNGVSTEALSRFSNAVAFSGHSHYPLTDNRSIWQGAFTSLGTGSLRYTTFTDDEFKDSGGFENDTGGSNKSLDADKTMDPLRRTNSRNGMLVSVFDDRICYRRRDFRWDEDLGPDWVMPLPAAESKPFAFAGQAKKSRAPEFAPAAKITATHGKAHTRKSKHARYKDNAEKEQAMQSAVLVSFPAARRTFETRAYYYAVEVIKADGTIARTKRVLSPDHHLPLSRATEKIEFALLTTGLLPGEEVRIKATAYDNFGNASESIESQTIKLGGVLSGTATGEPQTPRGPQVEAK